MRKTIIALMLILPLMFVFAVFSSVNIVSLGVNIAVSGIKITNKSVLGEGTLRIDLADNNDEHALAVSVLPENASNKGYSFKVEQVEGSELADVSVDENGVIAARSEGSARILAISNDGGYRDSITVLVGSSKPYDVKFALYDAYGAQVEMSIDENGDYIADVETGRYDFNAKVLPSGMSSCSIQATGNGVELDVGSGSVLLAFSGKAELDLLVLGGINGDIKKKIKLNIKKAETPWGFTVNGSSLDVIAASKGAKTISFYVEADSAPTIEGNGIKSVDVVEVAKNCYKMTVTPALDADFSAVLKEGDRKMDLMFTFRDFDFTLASDFLIEDNSTSVLVGTPVNFYAVGAVPSDNITYKWGVDGGNQNIISPSGAICVVNAAQKEDFVLWVEAYRGTAPLGIKQVNVSVISRVYGVKINNDMMVDLASHLTVGGFKYENGKESANKYLLDVSTFYDAGGTSQGEKDVEDLEFFVSDKSLASLDVHDGKVYLSPLGTGEVKVTFAWKGNTTFSASYGASITLNVVRNGVEVHNAPDLVKAASDGKEIVLTDDIVLGTDSSGAVLPLETRKNMLGKMKSTYNIEWYKNGGKERDAYINYVLEFKDDVYGNGHFINAENFTNSLDGTGTPELFRGPLFFVSMASMASVAGQDNCAFLVRTDGVKLYGVNLLGCSDQSLLNEENQYDLIKLNKVGTVLEINADCEVVNCRVRNGRNVVRVYGGNRDGNNYFVNSLSGRPIADEDRINVLIEGCIISYGREFLIKTGANRALKAVESNEPDLADENGKAYSVQTNNYLDDEYFYKTYVMTDLTLRNSVLETSGLFSIGVESNFAGAMLSPNVEGTIEGTKEWAGTGGTSFVSVVRLEGDVRMYDWKDISHIDSSTLIEAATNGVMKDWLKLDVGAMIDFVKNKEYGKIIKEIEGSKFVHGGIALYGGGKNYSQVSIQGLDEAYRDLSEFKINIDILKDSPDTNLQNQGSMLPAAAGQQDFRFYMYDAESANSYEKQIRDGSSGNKYSGIEHVNAF